MGGLILVKKVAPWKIQLWESASVEAAMLRAPMIFLITLLFWGINLWIYERIRLQYYNVLAIRSASLQMIFTTSITMLLFFVIHVTLFRNILGISVEFGVSIFYFFVLLYLITPNSPGHESRSSFFRLLRLVFFPVGTVTFPEILLADALTSMSKVFKDIAVGIVAMMSWILGSNIVDYHDFGIILIAISASLPFWIRVRQCSIQLDGAGDFITKVPIILNIIKYCTAFPPIWLAAAYSLGYTHPKLIWIAPIAAGINSTYGFLWDLIMDWGLITIHRTGRCTCRSRWLLPFPLHLISCLINLLLRFSWASNLIPYFSHLNPIHLVFIIQFAEVFRRALWNIFRVEWEVIVQQDRAAVKIRDEIEDDGTGILIPANLLSLK